MQKYATIILILNHLKQSIFWGIKCRSHIVNLGLMYPSYRYGWFDIIRRLI